MTWHEFWDSVSVAQAVVWIVGALAVLTFVVKAWPFIRNTFRILDALVRLPDVMEKVDDMTAQVSEIHHEVHYNNGSSVKDAVRRVETKLGRVEEGVAGLYERADASDRADADLRRELENTHPPIKRRPPKKETP
jgi:hypothetical protein